MRLSERELQEVWYGGREAGWSLRVLAAMFGAVSSLRRRLFLAGLLPRARLRVGCSPR